MTSQDKKIRAIIIAKGEVQRVGYRDAVERAARKMKLTGFVENVKPYDVRIICEGNKASVESFATSVKIKEFPVDVEHLDVHFEAATGEFEYFEIKRGDMTEELGERLDLARTELKQNTSILKENSVLLKENISVSKENTTLLKDFKEETNANFQVLHSDMIRHDTDAQERIAALNQEISEIKDRLKRVESAVGVS